MKLDDIGLSSTWSRGVSKAIELCKNLELLTENKSKVETLDLFTHLYFILALVQLSLPIFVIKRVALLMIFMLLLMKVN